MVGVPTGLLGGGGFEVQKLKADFPVAVWFVCSQVRYEKNR